MGARAGGHGTDGRTDGAESAGGGGRETHGTERAAEAASSRRGGRETTGVGVGGRERRRRRRSGQERAARAGVEGEAVGEKTRRSPPDRRALLPRPTTISHTLSRFSPPLSPSVSVSPPLNAANATQPPRSRGDGPATTSDGRRRAPPPTTDRRPPPAGRLGERARSAERRGRSPGGSARRQATPRRPAGRRRGTHPRGAAAHARLGLGPRRPPRHGEARRRGRARTPDARVGAPRGGRGGGPDVAGTPPGAGGVRRRNGRGPTTTAAAAGPGREGAGPSPPTDTPGVNAQRPLAARGRFPKGDRPRRPRGQGLVASSLSPSLFPLAGSAPPWPGGAASALRGTEGPGGPASKPPAAPPPGRRARARRHAHPGGGD